MKKMRWKTIALVIFAVACVIMFFHGVARCGEISLAWDAPVARVDGTPLPAAEIAGYNVYWGNLPGEYTGSKTVTGLEAMVDCVGGFDYYFAVTTLDTAGQESAYSNEVTTYVPLAEPGVPGNLRFK